MKIEGLIQPEGIIPELAATTKDQVLEELAARVAVIRPDIDGAGLADILRERERLGSTGIGEGGAIPHGKLKRLDQHLLVFGRSRQGVDYESIDGNKVNLFFLLVAPEEAVGMHLKILARLSRIFKDPAVRMGLLEAPGVAAIYETILKQDGRY